MRTHHESGDGLPQASGSNRVMHLFISVELALDTKKHSPRVTGISLLSVDLAGNEPCWADS